MRQTQRIVELGIPFAVGALLLGTALFSGWPVNHDSASYLQIGQLLLGGAVPYVDYVELNPPLVQYLHALPAALSAQLGLGLPKSFTLLVAALCLYSAYALYTETARTALLDRAQCAVLAAGWLCLSLAVICNNGFGQREHLFVLAYAPWLVLRFSRHRGSAVPAWRALAVAVLAAAFALLKPQLLLIIGAGELWLLYRSRRWRALGAPEALAFVGLGLLYGAHFWWMPDAMREQFFGRWVPMIAANYDSYDTGLLEILGSGVGIAVVISMPASLALTARLRRSPELAPLAETLCVGVLLGAIAFFTQHKGWSYHAYPCLGAAGLLSLLAVATTSRELGRSSGRDLTRVALLGIALLAIFFSYLAFELAPRVQAGARAIAVLIARDTEPGDRVAFIDTSHTPGSTALLYADRLPGIRFLPAFPIAFFSQQWAATSEDGSFAYPSAEEWSQEERQVLEEIGSDLRNNAPPLVLIRSDDCLACPPGFSIDEYLRRSGWSARHLAAYRALATSSGYAVYERRDRRPQ